MNTNTKLPKKHFNILLGAMAFIIFVCCLETLMKAKDYQLYEQWLLNLPNANQMKLGDEESYGYYTMGVLSIFAQKLIVPMIFSIHTYFAYTKIRINKLYVFMWTVLLAGSAAYTLIEWNIHSPFYFLTILFYMIAILTVLSLSSVIDNQSLNENKNV